jgi:hypothetical protein
VKTFFDNPTPNTVLAQNPALRSLDFPLIVVIGITEREREREETCTPKSYKANLK